MLGRTLGHIFNGVGGNGVYVSDFSGGTKDNVITRESICNILIEDESLEEKVINIVNQVSLMFKKEYEGSDEDVYVSINKIGQATNKVWGRTETENIVDFLNITPNGVINLCYGMNGLVETSLNLGITNCSDDAFNVGVSVRSSVNSRKMMVTDKVTRLIRVLGGKYNVHSEYPEWNFNRKSELQKKCVEIYKKEFGKDLKVEVIHAGLECGYLWEKKPELDIVSFGPLMYDIHSTEERLSISSTELTYKFVLKILEEV